MTTKGTYEANIILLVHFNVMIILNLCIMLMFGSCDYFFFWPGKENLGRNARDSFKRFCHKPGVSVWYLVFYNDGLLQRRH